MTADAQAAPAPPHPRLTQEDLEALAQAAEPLDCEEGEVIFERGESGSAMFVILEGSVRLVFDEAQPAKRLGAGDYFGELALMSSQFRRSATAVAGEPSRLLRLDEQAFEALGSSRPRLFFRLLRSTCAYLVESERRLVDNLRHRNEELGRTLDYLRRTREELDYQELMLHTDELTRLYNRRCFNLQQAKFIDRAQGMGSPLALILIDLDGFKAVNDTLGHPAGDQVLRKVAATIQGCLRQTDLPCRLGGDEFGILLPDAPEPHARARAEDLRAAIESAHLDLADPGLRIGASVGGTMYRHGESAGELFERADQSLYEAKRGGKNRVVWAEPTTG